MSNRRTLGLHYSQSASKAKARAIQSRLEELQTKQAEVVDDQAKHKREVDECRIRYAIAQRGALETMLIFYRLKQLDNADVQKLESLTRWSRDTGEVVKWLRLNQDKFKYPILEPPMLSLNVRDNRFVNAIEACFGANDMQVCLWCMFLLATYSRGPQTFVAQCNEDYRLLNQLVADTPDALGRKARINTWYRDPTQVAPPPLSPEDVSLNARSMCNRSDRSCPARPTRLRRLRSGLRYLPGGHEVFPAIDHQSSSHSESLPPNLKEYF